MYKALKGDKSLCRMCCIFSVLWGQVTLRCLRSEVMMFSSVRLESINTKQTRCLCKNESLRSRALTGPSSRGRADRDVITWQRSFPDAFSSCYIISEHAEYYMLYAKHMLWKSCHSNISLIFSVAYTVRSKTLISVFIYMYVPIYPFICTYIYIYIYIYVYMCVCVLQNTKQSICFFFSTA